MSSEICQIGAKLRKLPVLQGPFAEVDFNTFPASPHATFQIWLDEAIEAGVKEPHAMTVSTVDDQGWPDARVLILKNVDERGWHFAAKSESPKSVQIAHNDHVALTFYWPQVGRQIRIRGQATQLPEAECIRDFEARPLKSRVSAMASKQSQVLRNHDELLQRLAHVESTITDGQDQGTPKWKVYAVSPVTVEFWQGASDRLHRRVRYTSKANSGIWIKDLLWP